MSAEDMLRDLMRERLAEDRSRRNRWLGRHLAPAQSARLLDAAVAALAATRNLVGVGEQILRERRDALTGTDETQPTVNGDGPRKTHIDLTY